ncbi:MAG: SAM-dependent methyltransferase, partial [candidate division Zixibacteria bacterium]|nr:SAM-dependent methyltransferase [candidate division Zixibacteria bacterium]
MGNSPEEKQNIKFWDEVAPVHLRSYELDKLLNGGSVIDDIQRGELGDVTGKTMLHLQCHIGSDTLSWEREGAIVTGVDFSEESLKIANRLKEQLSLKS